MDRFRGGIRQLLVGSRAERIADGREGEAERDECRRLEDLTIAEPDLAKACDILLSRRVGSRTTFRAHSTIAFSRSDKSEAG